MYVFMKIYDAVNEIVSLSIRYTAVNEIIPLIIKDLGYES